MERQVADELKGPNRAGVDATDTIVAPASGAGPSAVAVIRVSGARTRAVLEALTGSVPKPRQASLRDIGAPTIDRGLVLWFPAPKSFTGEDMAELQVHGSRAVVAALVEAVLAIDGTRLAEPGEFARRAFENGKLDLTEVEGLADLINAETEAQRRQALAQSEGVAPPSLRTLARRAAEGSSLDGGGARLRRRGRRGGGCRPSRRTPSSCRCWLRSRRTSPTGAASVCAMACASSSPARPMPASRA